MNASFDFTSLIDRHGMDAIAVDGIGTGGICPDAPTAEGFDAIPMWVADMNFATAPVVTKAISERLDHPLFGYFSPRKEYFDAIIRWQKKRNRIDGLAAENIGYENGVLGGLLSAVRVFCSPGDEILVHSPTYIGFTKSLENAGYRLLHSHLVRDGAGVWRMDLADMEEKIVSHGVRTAILCSPHNPCGRVWEREELEAAARLFEKHGVKIISDEIWSDIILGGRQHVPTQSVSEYARMNTVALYAPTKTFNLAGLVGSYHIIYDKRLSERVLKESSLSHYNEMNVLSMHALIGAFSEKGEEWLDELLKVLDANVGYFSDYLNSVPGVSCFRPEGTYMIFADCTEYCEKTGKNIEDIEKAAWKVGVAVQDGRMFHGPCHLRFNLALPLSKLKEAAERLGKYVFV